MLNEPDILLNVFGPKGATWGRRGVGGDPGEGGFSLIRSPFTVSDGPTLPSSRRGTAPGIGAEPPSTLGPGRRRGTNTDAPVCRNETGTLPRENIF